VITPNNYPGAPAQKLFSHMHFSRTEAYFPHITLSANGAYKGVFNQRAFREPELFEEAEPRLAIEDLPLNAIYAHEA
jgi:hypothetical protein